MPKRNNVQFIRTTIKKNSATTHEYSESSQASIAQSGYVMLLGNFEDENRRLSKISEMGCHHQLVLVFPTVRGTQEELFAV